MKKFFALMLTLCLLCGAAALAEDATQTTEVYYQLAANEQYTVTIPAELNLTATEDGRPTEYMDVKIEAPDFNVPGKSISVKLTDAAFKLVNGTSEMPYTIQSNEGDKAAIALNGEVARWTFGDEAVTKELRVHVTSLDNALVAGRYSDQLTFTISVGTQLKQ
ncbi:MAG: hypothetical protein IKK34_11035 [Clostridia bacterium]|nr:hypothetical protein [Clostridia bacterium]